jgi:hypothetical protein
MIVRFRVAPCLLGLIAALCGGCQSSAGSGGGEFHLQPPAAWQTSPVEGVTVPGTPLAAWVGPERASLVVYRALPIPGGKAASLVEELANRLSNLPDLTVVARRTESWSGQEAARVEAIAPGIGDSFAPSGTGTPVGPKGRTMVPVRRVALGFPRAADTLWITWHYPDSAQATIAPQVEATLKTLRLSGSPATGY